MEGLPRMPMLSVELKFCPSSTDFSPKLKEYIAHVYEENPDTYSKEIDELNQLRDNAIKAPADFTGCGTLKKYFAQLHLLKSRFPMEENDAAAVPFTWYEKFSDMPSPVSFEDIRYESACVLHNIGAVHSYLATVDSRLTSDGMKVSCTHFQCAAWAFQTMRDDAEPFRFSSSGFSPDFDRNILDWYGVLMLAQAQECILEKSLVDNRKSHIIAKVAAQVSDYYAQAIRVLEQPSVSDVVGSSKCRSWRKFVDMKRKFYRAVAYYEMGTQADEQQKMGERLAYFQAAANDLTDAAKLGHKESPGSIQQSLQFAEDVIVARLNQAKKENDFIYHEKIPTLDSLPELKGASLVKAIPFDPLDGDVSGGDIFKRLIPLEVHRTSSLYSEEKAKLLRRVSDDVDAKNASLDEFVASLKIDQLMLDVDFSQLPLPESLIERCAAFNARPSAVSDLLAQMSKLTNSYRDVESIISEIENKISRSDREARNIMSQLYGTTVDGDDDDRKAKLPNDVRASILVRLKTFADELDRYRRAHEQATKANGELHKALSAHSENLRALSSPLAELKKQLPSPADNLSELPATAEMKRLLAKVDEMKRQRDTLMEQLRQQIRDDDVTKNLLAAKDKDEQEVFSKEIKKHEKQIGVIDQNLSAQENILKALTEANAKYGEIRKQMNATIKQRDAKIMNLVAAYEVYTDLESKSKEGIEFYEKLKKSLRELDAALTKWSETELDSFRNKAKAESEKKAAAVEAKKAAAAAAAASMAASATASAGSMGSMGTMANDPQGPKLKDYMAYYRAKKAGQAAAFPTTGVNTAYPNPAATFTAAGTSMGYPMTTGANGAYPTTGVNATYPTSVVGGSYTTAGTNGTGYPTSNVNTTYQNPAAPAGGTFTTAGPSMGYPMTTSANGQVPMSGQFPMGNVNMGYLTEGINMPYSTVGINRPYEYTASGTVNGTFPPQTVNAPSSYAVPIQAPMAPQVMPTNYGYNSIFLEPVAFGSDYVRLRWRYDGPKPAKYMITFRGYQRYDAGMGRWEEREVDTGAPIKTDADHYILNNLHPDTDYAFEVAVVDEASGRIFGRSSTVRVNTNSSLL